MNWKRKSERSWGRLGMRYKTEKLGKFLYIKGRIGWKGLKKSEYLEHSEYKIINGESLTKNGINWDKAGYISKERYDESPEIMLQNEDILISKDGTIGKLGFVENLSSKATVASGIFVLRNLRSNLINTRFIYNYLSSSYFSKFIISRTEGSVIPHLYQKDFVELDFPLPSLEIQKKIVEILDAISLKIKLNNAINNNLEQQAVLLFKKWFIEFDNSSKNMLETRFGLVPESFKLLKNGELPLVVTDYVANGSFASLKANVTLYQEPNYAYFIRNTDLKSGTFEVFVDEHSYNFLSKSTLYGGEIIISNVGDVGSVFLCPKLDKPMTLGNNIIMLRPEQENLRYYLYIWFKWLYGQSLIQGIKGGSAQPKFNKTDFKNLPIFLPPDDLLEQFHQIVKPMFELINENNTENQALTRTRDTILPRLMSGELDVSDIDF